MAVEKKPFIATEIAGKFKYSHANKLNIGNQSLLFLQNNNIFSFLYKSL